jgi:hypothetical protein
MQQQIPFGMTERETKARAERQEKQGADWFVSALGELPQV